MQFLSWRAQVLLVDDDPFIRRLVRQMLEDVCDVAFAEDGAVALDRLRAGERYDLILCDLMMPRVTGMEVWDTICREMPGLRGRFLVVTGGSGDPRATAFLARKEAPVLYKPFTTEELLSAVVSRLPSHPPSARSA